MKRNLFFVTASVLALTASAAMAGDNTVYLDQYTETQKADIKQEGAGSSVGGSVLADHFYQSGAGHNDLTVRQTATSKKDTVNGHQTGDTNKAFLTQSGEYSDIVLKQDGTKNGASNAELLVTKNTITQNGTSSHSDATFTQNGSYNLFDITQGGAYNVIAASQNGASNTIKIEQALYKDGSYGNAHNETISKQNNASNSGDYTQIGSYNKIDSTQYGNATAAIYQIGKNNQTLGAQSAGVNNVNISQGVNNVAYGTNNYAYYNQSGTNLALSVIQMGNHNSSNTNQSGNGSSATIVQK